MILSVTPNPCVDKTVFVDRLEPGEKIRSLRCSCVAGGKGCNVARAAHAMGRKAVAMTLVGGAAGRQVVDMLEKDDGLECVPVWVEGMTRTITTILEEPIHRQTAVFEPGPEISAEERRMFVEKFTVAAESAGVVTFNGSVPHKSMDSLYRELLPIAHAAGAVTILDAYGTVFELALQERPFMAKPNVEEAAQLLGRPLRNLNECWYAVEWLRDRGIRLVALSLGKDGALVSFDDWTAHVIPPCIRECNPVGSGDAMVAGFAIGLAENLAPEDMATLGVAMGTANAMVWDIGHFSPEQVHRLKAQVRCVSPP